VAACSVWLLVHTTTRRFRLQLSPQPHHGRSSEQPRAKPPLAAGWRQGSLHSHPRPAVRCPRPLFWLSTTSPLGVASLALLSLCAGPLAPRPCPVFVFVAWVEGDWERRGGARGRARKPRLTRGAQTGTARSRPRPRPPSAYPSATDKRDR
jgi:hypothetical protein